MCLTEIHVQLTRCVWGDPTSIDKMLLIFPAWECLRPGGQRPDSDSNWLEFKPFLVSRLFPLKLFSSQHFSIVVTVAKLREWLFAYTSSCFEKLLSNKHHQSVRQDVPVFAFCLSIELFDWRRIWHTFKSGPRPTDNNILYLCLSVLLFLYQF